MPTKNLDAYAVVRAALIKRTEREAMTDIAKNAEVPYGWLQQFFYGNIEEPGHTKFTKLATYLGVPPEELANV